MKFIGQIRSLERSLRLFADALRQSAHGSSIRVGAVSGRERGGGRARGRPGGVHRRKIVLYKS
jgi:hypothetical protein